MALINLRNLGVTLSAPLFSNLNLAIGPADRLGIVAANGRGKSTLLRCIAGAFDPTAGEITRSRGLRVGHVEQDIPDGLLPVPFYELVHQALAGGAERSRKVARRRDARLARGSRGASPSAAGSSERRLAKAGPARPRLGERPRHAASRRADQPPRSRQDQPARGLAERASTRHSRGDLPATTGHFSMRRPTGRCSCGRSTARSFRCLTRRRALPWTKSIPRSSAATSRT